MDPVPSPRAFSGMGEGVVAILKEYLLNLFIIIVKTRLADGVLYPQ
jgi:hypothetical protein